MQSNPKVFAPIKSLLERDGFALLPAALNDEETEHLDLVVERLLDVQLEPVPGLRHLLTRSAELRAFAHSAATELARHFLPDARAVRCILFDKTPTANWYVTWHQDRTIPVRSRIDVPEFGPWSVKDGIQHVQPPARILEQMLSLRFHLDDSDEGRGAIKFIAGSHTRGLMEPDEIAQWRDSREHHLQSAKRGDVILMRPLTLHASSEATNPKRRRVVHIEFAGCELPGGLQWGES